MIFFVCLLDLHQRFWGKVIDFCHKFVTYNKRHFSFLINLIENLELDKVFNLFSSLNSSLDKIIFSNKLYNRFHSIFEFCFVFDVNVKRICDMFAIFCCFSEIGEVVIVN
jgi:hypothetical protein